MGYALSWAALKGRRLENMCSALGLRTTGEREEIPESDVVGLQLRSAWAIVLFNRNTIKQELLEELSRSGEVVSCFVEEHVMVSAASGWKDGKLIWSVTHDCSKGLSHLALAGTVPPAMESIQQRLLSEARAGEQGDTDYLFDAPVELAMQLTGFRHDQDLPGISSGAFEVLEFTNDVRRSKGSAGRLARLFGRKGRQ